MKGIILAGGTATRLFPMTMACCKQLLPVYDKPMLFYPLTTLIEIGCDDILVICRPDDEANFKKLLKSICLDKIKITVTTQEHPRGLAEAYIIAGNVGFLTNNEPSYLILGDNIFDGNDWSSFSGANNHHSGFNGLVTRVAEPDRYGVVQIDSDDGKKIKKIVEKPTTFISDFALTGIYYFSSDAIRYAESVKPSKRGELEIVDLIQQYDNKTVDIMNSTGAIWLDAGILSSYHETTQYVQAIQNRSGRLIGSPEYALFMKRKLSANEIRYIVNTQYKNSEYGISLLNACQRYDHQTFSMQ